MTATAALDVPDDWLRPTDDEVDRALRVARRALSDDSERPAVRRLANYYQPSKRGAGTTFLELEPIEPATVTVADLHAVTVLSVRIKPLATRRLLTDQARRADIDAALAGLDLTTDLADADRKTYLAMEALWSEIYEACRDPWVPASNPWVTAAKLCARKRPRLLPVRDNIVCKGLGLFGTPQRRKGNPQVDWQVFAHLMRDHYIVDRIDELTHQVQAAHRVQCDSVRLRVLDVALWTWLPH
ncbi:DUF6308 family protein [Geodermatophilus sp. SYSU D00703]